MTNEDLITKLTEIVNKFHLLIYLKLQLDKDVNSTINWNLQLNGRVKMYLTDMIFTGILIHLWF
jgi:hypothetical protein